MEPQSWIKRMGLSALLIVSSAFLAGCRIAPPPSRAEIHQHALTNVVLTNNWKATGAASGPIGDNWLPSFGDPQLILLVDEALRNNPDLRIAAARVEQAAGQVELAKSALRPTVNLIGTGGLNAGGGDISSALQGLWVGASWEPDVWGRLRYGRDATKAIYESAEADLEFARQSIAATTAKSWFTATETWLHLQIAESSVGISSNLLMLAEKRFQVGIGNEQDIGLARANLGSLEDSVQQARLAHHQAVRALELLLGRYPAAEVKARHSLPVLSESVPVGMPLEMLERRPDLIAAERRVAAAFNRVGEAKAARLPKVALNASFASLTSEVLQLKSDFKNPTGGVGGRFVAPLYQGGALQAQIKIRTAEQKEAVLQYGQAALRAIGDVENALAAGQTLTQREQLLRRVVVDSERNLELAQINYRVGQLDLRSVQQQHLSVYTARIALLRVQSEQLSQRANLFLALGGTFQTAPVQNPTREGDALIH